MNHFRYRALTASGLVREGVQEGDSSATVFRDLRRNGWWPIKISPIASGEDRLPSSRGRRPFPAKVMAGFFHELAMLIGASIALDRSLAMLTERHRSDAIGKSAGRLLSRVREGASLASALSSEPAFPNISIGLARAGEASGTLPAELTRLADMMTRTAAIRTEIASALVYPAILLVTAGLSVGIIMLFVIPEFEPLFQDSGRAPPEAFQFLMMVSSVIFDYGWLALATACFSFVVFRKLPQSAKSRIRLDKWKLKIPLIGILLRELETGRFCRTLGTLVKADLALPIAVQMASNAVENASMSRALGSVTTGLREGRTLVDRLSATEQLSSESCGLLKVGEESGRLGDMLLHQADISDANARTTITRLLAMMVPAITIALGMVVAFIVTSLLVAILSVNNLATG